MWLCVYACVCETLENFRRNAAGYAATRSPRHLNETRLCVGRSYVDPAHVESKEYRTKWFSLRYFLHLSRTVSFFRVYVVVSVMINLASYRGSGRNDSRPRRRDDRTSFDSFRHTPLQLDVETPARTESRSVAWLAARRFVRRSTRLINIWQSNNQIEEFFSLSTFFPNLSKQSETGVL